MQSPMLKGALAALALLLTVAPASAQQPRITELVAVNAASLTDGDGNTPDWIEIHNPRATALDLAGYHLTDDPEIPDKYTFPATATIPAGGYLVVFASGKTEPAYTDAAGNFHTTFSLSGDGEYLALNAPDGTPVHEFTPAFPPQREDASYGETDTTPAVTTPLVTANADATWLVPGGLVADAWHTDPAFDDSTWTTAKTGIGYAFAGLLGEGGDTRSAMWFANATVYIRLPFTVGDPSAVTALTLDMKYDDGFVAYINGQQVASANAPAALTHTSNATAEHPDEDALIFESFPLAITPGLLNAGSNVLAIHGLNFSSSGTGSSDFLALPTLTATSTTGAGGTNYGYFTEPTPGAANTTPAVLGFVKDTKFSHDRGYHNTPFDLTITTTTEGATIYYTTDGTPPSTDNGTAYTAPLTISETTTLRAIATRGGFEPTNIDTQTFLFVDDIIRQPARPAGYPTTWGGVAADYEMDPEVVDDLDYSDKFHDAFAALPTLSLVFDPDALFHRSTGIYQRPTSSGSAWERPTSAELIVPDGSEPGFQIDAGIRIQGGSSRNTDTPKHSLSLRFRAEYGTEKLRYPLYENTPGGASAIDRFDVLQLRPEYNFGWMHRHYYQAHYAQYGRDQWASDLFLAMGQNGSHGRWVHLFLNGIYWGLYDLQERPDANHMANYFGGDNDEYDTINSRVATNGNTRAYQTLTTTASRNPQTDATYQNVQGMLDVDAFIDYMLLNAYVGNRDWDGHNWRAARKREDGAKWLFFPWDTEFAISHVGGGAFTPPPNFFTTSLSTDVTGKNNGTNPTGIQSDLQRNAEYRLRYADRVRRHMFNGGPLTPQRAAAIWTARATKMTTAIVAESARWGDHRRDQNPGRWRSDQFDLFTRDGHYLPTQQWAQETYLPRRTGLVIAQLRRRNLYPDTDAPDFSQHGGTVPAGFALQITAPATVHYTTDGSDPRLAGGGVNPSASTGTALTLNQSTHLKARVRANDAEWSALTEATFTVAATDLAITEIMYRPADQPLSEFIELTNTGPLTLALTGLHFTRGFDFDFDQHSTIQTLAPGARLLLVRDTDAFRAVHGDTHDPLIAGIFQNGTALSNNGETITLSDAADNVILTLTYNDKSPWPESADAGGRSLVSKGGDPDDPQNWRPSATENGNPGTTDSTPYDAAVSVLDYTLAAPLQLTPTPQGITLSYTVHLTADDATITVQQSADLTTWQTTTPDLLTQTLNPDNTHTITLQLPPDTTGYLRLTATTAGN